MKDGDLYWLAGLLEGEGSFGYHLNGGRRSGRISIQIGLTDLDVIERVAILFNRKVYCHKKRQNRKQSYSTFLTGPEAVILMRSLTPLMGNRRKNQIISSIEAWENRLIKLRQRGLPSICHPDRPHKGLGLCWACYRRHRYLTKELPARKYQSGVSP